MQSARPTCSQQEGPDAEETPLLHDAAGAGGEGYGSIDATNDANVCRRPVTPLPKGQVALLSFMRLATPLVDSQALPVRLSFF